MADRRPTRTPRREEDQHQVPGSSEDFVPQTTTDVAQHAPGPHGQGDEPTSAPAGRFNYDEADTPKVRKPSNRTQ